MIVCLWVGGCTEAFKYCVKSYFPLMFHYHRKSNPLVWCPSRQTSVSGTTSSNSRTKFSG